MCNSLAFFCYFSRFSLFPEIAIFFVESCEQRLRLTVSEVLGCVGGAIVGCLIWKTLNRMW